MAKNSYILLPKLRARTETDMVPISISRLGRAGGIDPLGEANGQYPTINGVQWQVWYGTNPSNGQQTYSFVVNDGAWLESFQGDIMDFWDWLVDNEGFPGGSQYLLSMCALLDCLFFSYIWFEFLKKKGLFSNLASTGTAYQFGTEPFTGSNCNLNVTWFTASMT
jgi:hypothetical protein